MDRRFTAGNEDLVRFVGRRIQGREQKSEAKVPGRAMRGQGGGGMDDAPDEKTQHGILDGMGGFPNDMMPQFEGFRGHVRIQPQQKRHDKPGGIPGRPQAGGSAEDDNHPEQ